MSVSTNTISLLPPSRGLPISHQPQGSTSSLRRTHRHRRSAAISGEFDMREFGMLPPVQAYSTSQRGCMSVPGSPTKARGAFLTLAGENEPKIAQPQIKVSKSPPAPLKLTPKNSRSSLGSPFTRPVAHFTSRAAGIQPGESPQSLPGSPSHFFMTEEARFTARSDVPDAVIDLDDVFSEHLQSLKPSRPQEQSSRTSSAPELEPFCYPKHSLLCSPKKNEVAIVEEITEEDGDANSTGRNASSSSSTTSISASSHCSAAKSCLSTPANLEPLQAKVATLSALTSKKSGSATSLSSETRSLSTISSVSSLRGKVRYQSYFQNQKKLASPTLGPVRMPAKTRPTSVRFSDSHSPSPAHFRRRELLAQGGNRKKNPFRYQSQVYEVSPDAFKDLDLEIPGETTPKTPSLNGNWPSLPPPDEKSSRTSFTQSRSPSPSGFESHDQPSRSPSFSPDQHEVASSQSSACSSPKYEQSTKVQPSLLENHHRSGSIISSISSRLHHHGHGNSVFSLKSFRSLSKRASFVESATDELLGLNLVSGRERISASSPVSSSSNSFVHQDTTMSTHDAIAAERTLLSDEATVTSRTLGEPGPMVDVSVGKYSKESSPLSNISNTGSPKKRKPATEQHKSASSGRHGRSLLHWMLKNKR
ncbi:hypothetical protein BRETT_003595 [Brettanomyces bruxellensis]|uniref:Uncharacterized protein n=1 Tax=Dekkera bruxellensis TaxID=5007 RepID=A0A871R6S9_DEKBR|nr:uncharacterized protein BRETT_003595 [Brettanomyces bruxellensis]QOU19448.1 hypothetical protein BRETT_003595 [Brettanomyces bruxellensis]